MSIENAVKAVAEADIPERIKDLVLRLTMDDPAVVKYLLQVVLTLYVYSAKDSMPIPFAMFEEGNPFGITGEGAIMCGIDTENKMLRLCFLPGDKDSLLRTNAEINKTRVADGKYPVEMTDPSTEFHRA